MKAIDKYEERAKQYRKIKKRLNDLYTIFYREGWDDLPKPERFGWFKEVALSEEVLRRHDAYVFIEILDACKVSLWAREKKYLERSWEIKYRNKKPQKPGLRNLSLKEYSKLSNEAKKYFYKKSFFAIEEEEKIYCYSCILPRIFFVYAYRRAYRYRIQRINSKVQAEIAELRNSIEKKYIDFKQKEMRGFDRGSFLQQEKDSHKQRLRVALVKLLKNEVESDVLYQTYKVSWW
jgi:hypothetical protein